MEKRQKNLSQFQFSASIDASEKKNGYAARAGNSVFNPHFIFIGGRMKLTNLFNQTSKCQPGRKPVSRMCNRRTSACFVTRTTMSSQLHTNNPPPNSVNKYFSISGKTLTKALKAEHQTVASRRFNTEVKSQSYKNGDLVKTVDLTTGKEVA